MYCTVNRPKETKFFIVFQGSKFKYLLEYSPIMVRDTTLKPK